MPNFSEAFHSYFFKGPTIKDLEPDLLNLTPSEQKVILSVMQKDSEMKGKIEEQNIIADWTKKFHTTKKCCEKRHCHCDYQEKELKMKRKRLKSLKSPSVEYALELSKQILESPSCTPKSPSQEISCSKTIKKNSATHLTVTDGTGKRRPTLLKSSKVSLEWQSFLLFGLGK